MQVSTEIGNISQRTTIKSNYRSLLWATLATLILWFLPYSNYFLYPLRLFVTFIHESGHALAGVISGQSVQSLHVHPDGSGVTYVGTSQIWNWLTLSGGYVGTALFGALLLQVGRIKGGKFAGRTTLYVLSVCLLLVTLLWANNPFNNPGSGPDFFTLPVGLLLAAGLFALGRFSKPKVAEFASAFLAIQCGLNALGDLKILFNLASAGHGANDAATMQKLYLLPSVVWAVLWMSIAVVVLGLSLWTYIKTPQIGVKKPQQINA